MLSSKNYLPAASPPFEFSDQEREREIMQQAAELRIGKAADGQRVAMTYANHEAGGRGAVVRLAPVFARPDNADQLWIPYQSVAAMPDRAHFNVGTPAHGASDKLTDEQRKDIRNRNGSLASVARSRLEAVLDIEPALDNIIVEGEAFGSVLAKEFAVQAATRGIRVRRLVGVTPVGMEDSSLPAIAGRGVKYLIDAQVSRMRRSKETERPGEQESEDAFSKVFVPKMAAPTPTREATRRGHIATMSREISTSGRLLLYKSPLARDTGAQALEAALELDPELKAYLVFAGKGVIGRFTPSAQANVERIEEVHPGRVEHDVWEQDGQDLGLARHQPRIVKLIRDIQ